MVDLHAAIEVHAVNPNRRVILDPQIDMLANPKPKVARLGKVLFPQLVLLDFKPTFEDFFGFGTADGDVDGDFLVAADAERADGVAGFACRKEGGLAPWNLDGVQ